MSPADITSPWRRRFTSALICPASRRPGDTGSGHGRSCASTCPLCSSQIATRETTQRLSGSMRTTASDVRRARFLWIIDRDRLNARLSSAGRPSHSTAARGCHEIEHRQSAIPPHDPRCAPLLGFPEGPPSTVQPASRMRSGASTLAPASRKPAGGLPAPRRVSRSRVRRRCDRRGVEVIGVTHYQSGDQLESHPSDETP